MAGSWDLFPCALRVFAVPRSAKPPKTGRNEFRNRYGSGSPYRCAASGSPLVHFHVGILGKSYRRFTVMALGVAKKGRDETGPWGWGIPAAESYLAPPSWLTAGLGALSGKLWQNTGLGALPWQFDVCIHNRRLLALRTGTKKRGERRGLPPILATTLPVLADHEAQDTQPIAA